MGISISWKRRKKVKWPKARLERGKMSTVAKIEALLFVAGEDGIRVRQLAELLSLPPTGIQQSLEKLVQKYEKGSRLQFGSD